MKKLLAIFIVLLLFCSLTFLSPPPVLAILPGPGLGPGTAESIETLWKEAVKQGAAGETNLEYYIAESVTNMGQTINTGVMGVPVEVAQGPTGPVYAREGGAIGIVSNLVATLYTTQPASSVEYLADVGKNLGLAPPAYAQGLGWAAFSPIMDLWKAFRNVAYLAFVVIFVVIGFMIMFRTKIDPQTVIGVQNALPRIIVTLLLITFSYAIAGFLIDLMSLSISLVLRVLTYLIPSDREVVLSENLFNLVRPLGTGAVGLIQKAIWETGLPLPEPAGESWAFKVIGWITVGVVFGIAAFFIMFKIFFMLLGSYIGIILAVVFAPLRLLLGALPGTNALGGWLKGLVADLLVFPATFVMLLLAAIFQAGSGHDTGVWKIIGGPGPFEWAPPLIGTKWGTIIGPIISFGILFTIPAVGAAIKQAFAMKPSPLAGRAMEEIRAKLGWVPFIGGTLERVGV